MEDFIMEFQRLCKRAEKYDILTIADGAKAFMLLEAAQLENRDELLVLTSVNFNEKDTIYEQMSASLIKFFGKQAVIQNKNPTITVKEDTLFTTSGNRNRGAYGAQGYRGGY